MIARALATLALVFLGSCYVDPTDKDRDDKEDDWTFDMRSAECQHGSNTGCIQGQVPSAQEITVEGKSYFDVDALGQGFGELVKASTPEGAELTGSEFKVNLLSKLSNDNFAEEFKVYLKGYSARAETILRNGSFAINSMRPGFYDIRVQRPIKFELEEIKAPVTPATDGTAEVPAAEPVAEPVKKLFCGALYSDTTLEVREGYRTPTAVFDNFKLYVRNSECKIDADTGDITLTF